MSHEANSLEPYRDADRGLQSAASSAVSPADDTSPVARGATPPLCVDRGAYEIKFLLSEPQSQVVREWARAHLLPDPHSTAESGFGYAVNSLYLDTPQFDVFHRSERYRQRKFRIRRYGSEAVVWLELKRKTNGRVQKRRTPIAEGNLEANFISPADPDWKGNWFRRRVHDWGLRPVCQVSYERFACVGTSLYGPIRLTIDSQLSCLPAAGWTVPSQQRAASLLLPNQHILEMKFRETIPNSFRDLIGALRLDLATFSKYRQSVETCVTLERLMGDA